jgi:hypothetical protein
MAAGLKPIEVRPPEPAVAPAKESPCAAARSFCETTSCPKSGNAASARTNIGVILLNIFIGLWVWG